MDGFIAQLVEHRTGNAKVITGSNPVEAWFFFRPALELIKNYVIAAMINPSIHKKIKNALECIVELYKHAGIFKNTREVHKE